MSILLIPILYMILNNYVQDNIRAFETNKAHKTAVQVQDYFVQSASIAIYATNMTTIPRYELSETGDYWHQKILTDNINSYIASCKFISNITVNGENENFYGGGYIADNHTYFLGTYRSCEIYTEENPSWPYSIKFHYGVKNKNSRTVDLYINSRYISETLFDENVYLVDAAGRIVLARNLSLVGKPVTDLYDAGETFNIHRLKSTDQYFISSETIDGGTVTVITISPKSDYSNQFRTILLVSLSVSLPIMLIVLLLAILLISNIYRPIRNIAETFKYHLPEDEGSFENEIAYINDSISKTLASNQQLNEELPKAILLSKKSQAQAVYSQISPHFIFNTLDNIKWQSIMELGFDNNIEQSIVLLNSMIYECLQQNDMIATVSKEMEITENYIELMRRRYENFFDVIWDVDEEVKNALIIKLTLQPLIENSITYSFDPAKEGQYIRIQAHKAKTEDSILITISDNGRGIEPKRLTQILNDLQSEEPLKKHIGIKNIHLRYHLLYGDAYGIINIESNNNGTTVTLRIPFHKQ